MIKSEARWVVVLLFQKCRVIHAATVKIFCWHKCGTAITKRLQEARINNGSWCHPHASLECRVQGIGMTLLGHAGIQVPSFIPGPCPGPQGTVVDCGQSSAIDNPYSHSQVRLNANLIFSDASKQELHTSLFGENEQFLIMLKLHSLDPVLSIWNTDTVTSFLCPMSK